ncbi:class I SAM-dependent methyltransferase [Vulgatibacter incomptus]|uniref:class I SAM-dependent methyltransferase n=1 Tax=Vulgatibacter incomptus TaxID=1391653 RepID=UPI00147030CB|nr:class I SAM-dependent methyltransferase [Vulgatibacter incomptus]
MNKLCAERLGRVDGSSQFPRHLDRLLRPAMRVVDLGGGKHPAISPEQKQRLGLHVVGVDISSRELEQAPAGAYDEAVEADASSFVRPGSADLVLAQALTEHVKDTRAMWRSIYATLVPGGRTLHFIPNGRALFARLNRLLPEEAKRFLLYRIYPESVQYLGFPAFYDRCSPGETRRVLREVGFRQVRIQPYYSSNYFAFLLPAHLANVSLQLLAQAAEDEDRCQSFVVEAMK